MRFISAAVVGALLLVTLAVPLSSPVSAAEGSTVAVLFDFGDGRVEWADVEVTEGMNALNATVIAAEEIGLDLVVADYGWGAFVETIEGMGYNPDTWEFWGLWTWNATKGEWESSMIGASSIPANSVTAISWFYSSSFSDGSLATPEHRFPWTSFRHDNFNTGSQPKFAPNNFTLLWEKDLGNGAIDSAVVGANGLVYVITGGILNYTSWGYDSNAAIYCLDEGEVVWSAEIGTGYQVATPLLIGDMVVVPSADGNVYAFNSEDGELRWTFDTGSSTYGVTSSPIYYQNHIFVAASNGKVFSIDSSGNEAWNETIAQVIYSSSPAARDGAIYIGADDGKLHALASNGSGELWSLTIGGKVRGSPIAMDDYVVASYVIYNGSSPISGGLAAVNYDGELVWNVSTAASPASPALTSVGFALVTYNGLTMIGFDGVKLWNTSLGATFSGAAPTAVSGTIFAVPNGAQAKVAAVSEDGELYWQQALLPDQYALSAPTVIDGVLYVTSDNGKVYAFSLNNVAPTASEFASITSGLAVTFTAPASGSYFHYEWDFGDGNRSTGKQATHTYAQAGTYDVKLIITSPDGASANVTKSITLAGTNTTSEIPMWAWIVAVIGIVAVAGLAVVMLRRKK